MMLASIKINITIDLQSLNALNVKRICIFQPGSQVYLDKSDCFE